MGYSWLVSASSRERVTANERSAIVSQKLVYWSKWPSAFHIHGQCQREALLDACQLVAVGDELVAAADEAGHDACAGLERRGNAEQTLIGSECRGQSLHLSRLVLGAAVHIMIGHGCPCHHVHHTQRCIYTACHTCVHQHRRCIVMYEFHGSHRSVHLAYSALHEH